MESQQDTPETTPSRRALVSVAAPQSGMDRKLEKKKWPPRRIALYGFVGLLSVIIAYYLLFGVNPSTLNVQAEKLTIVVVTSAPFQEFIPVQGIVLPLTTIYLDAIEGGRVGNGSWTKGASSTRATPSCNCRIPISNWMSCIGRPNSSNKSITSGARA